MTRLFEEMTSDDRRYYMQLLMSATETIAPPDAKFAIVMVGDKGAIEWIHSLGFDDAPQTLRESAAAIERSRKVGN